MNSQSADRPVAPGRGERWVLALLGAATVSLVGYHVVALLRGAADARGHGVSALLAAATAVTLPATLLRPRPARLGLMTVSAVLLLAAFLLWA